LVYDDAPAQVLDAQRRSPPTLPNSRPRPGAIPCPQALDLAACELGTGQLICAKAESIELATSAPLCKTKPMREYVMIWGLLSLGLGLPPGLTATGGQSRPADDEKAKPTKDGEQETSLWMSPGIVCKSIDGFEKYERLAGAAQTADEKLLVYIRVHGFKIEQAKGYYRAHLVPDFEIRKRGDKAVLLQKKKMFEYEPKSRDPLQEIYMKNQISLKGLKPGDYYLTLILHDEVAKGKPASQVIKFKVIEAEDPRKKAKENAKSDDDRSRTD
jgi:hypothetical protein